MEETFFVAFVSLDACRDGGRGRNLVLGRDPTDGGLVVLNAKKRTFQGEPPQEWLDDPRLVVLDADGEHWPGSKLQKLGAVGEQSAPQALTPRRRHRAAARVEA